jgi:trehalose 6-phosphate phosphatase
MVLELRPDVAVDKGVAVTALLTARPVIESAIFIGDDLTDLDAFEALDGLVASQKLGSATKVAVLSGETSDLGLAERADIELSGPGEVADLIVRIGG